MRRLCQALAYVYARETRADADTTKVLMIDEARRIASNVTKLPALLRRCADLWSSDGVDLDKELEYSSRDQAKQDERA